jgi:hypothetical protein
LPVCGHVVGSATSSLGTTRMKTSDLGFSRMSSSSRCTTVFPSSVTRSALPLNCGASSLNFATMYARVGGVLGSGICTVVSESSWCTYTNSLMVSLLYGK